MGECICSSCKNLKGKIGDEGAEVEYECQFGFPSDRCEDCTEEDCCETCDNYIPEEDEDTARHVTCKKCGKELTQTCADDSDDGEVFCIDCYLSESGE